MKKFKILVSTLFLTSVICGCGLKSINVDSTLPMNNGINSFSENGILSKKNKSFLGSQVKTISKNNQLLYTFQVPDGSGTAFGASNKFMIIDLSEDGLNNPQAFNIDNVKVSEDNATMSADGKVAYISKGELFTVVLKNNKFIKNKIVSLPGETVGLLWSNKGDKVLLRTAEDSYYLVNINGNSIKKLTDFQSSQSLSYTFPKWSPDDNKVYFSSIVKESTSNTNSLREDDTAFNYDVFSVDTNTGKKEVFLNSLLDESPPIFSPDLKSFFYKTSKLFKGINPDIYVKEQKSKEPRNLNIFKKLNLVAHENLLDPISWLNSDKILFKVSYDGGYNYRLFSINKDGSNLTRLSKLDDGNFEFFTLDQNKENILYADYSTKPPTDPMIPIFYMYSMKVDGTGIKRLKLNENKSTNFLQKIK